MSGFGGEGKTHRSVDWGFIVVCVGEVRQHYCQDSRLYSHLGAAMEVSRLCDKGSNRQKMMYASPAPKSPSFDALCNYHHRPYTPAESCRPHIRDRHTSFGSPHVIQTDEKSVLLVLPDGFCLLSDSDCSSGEVATHLWLKSDCDLENPRLVSDARRRATRSYSEENLQKLGGLWKHEYSHSYDGRAHTRQESPKHILESFKQLNFQDGDFSNSQDVTSPASISQASPKCVQRNYKNESIYQDGDSAFSQDGSPLSQESHEHRRQELNHKNGPQESSSIELNYKGEYSFFCDADSARNSQQSRGQRQVLIEPKHGLESYNEEYNYQENGETYPHDGSSQEFNHSHTQETFEAQVMHRDGDSCPCDMGANDRLLGQESPGQNDLNRTNGVQPLSQGGSTDVVFGKENLKHEEKASKDLSLHSFSHETTFKHREKGTKDLDFHSSSSQDGSEGGYNHGQERFKNPQSNHEGITSPKNVMEEISIKLSNNSNHDQSVSQDGSSPKNSRKSSKYTNLQNGSPKNIRKETPRSHSNSQDDSPRKMEHDQDGNFNYPTSQDGSPKIRHERSRHPDARSSGTTKFDKCSRRRSIACPCMAYSRAFSAANSGSETDSFSLKSWRLHPIEISGKENIDESASSGSSPASCSRGSDRMGRCTFIQEYHQWICHHHRVAIRSGMTEMNGCRCCSCCCHIHHERLYSKSCCIESSGSLCYSRDRDKAERVVAARVLQRRH